ncbi:MAG: type II toxin-antitoxin system VapC family toxin [Terriglobia bacterium]
MKKVLDTNAILYLLGGRLAQPLPAAQYFISVISEMELLSYPAVDDAALDAIRKFLSEVVTIELTEEIRDLAIRLRRKYSLKLPDAIVAATAQSLQAELLTNDEKLLRVPDLPTRRLNLK